MNVNVIFCKVLLSNYLVLESNLCGLSWRLCPHLGELSIIFFNICYFSIPSKMALQWLTSSFKI